MSVWAGTHNTCMYGRRGEPQISGHILKSQCSSRHAAARGLHVSHPTARHAHYCYPCYWSQVCTIHQPNSDITDNFDDYLLLSAGRAVYGGVWAGAVDFFAKAGYG